MTGYRPARPSGSSRFHVFMQAIWDYLWGGRFPFVDTDSVKVHRTSAGYAFQAFLPGAGGKGKLADTSYKGIYVKGQSYDALEWVVVQSGLASGAYISTSDSNTNDPTTGINWVQFSATPQWF